VDAAVATAFALGVAEPFMSGAYGAMVIQTSEGRAEVADFTTRAPSLRTP